jgi:hypothetical protein
MPALLASRSRLLRRDLHALISITGVVLSDRNMMIPNWHQQQGSKARATCRASWSALGPLVYELCRRRVDAAGLCTGGLPCEDRWCLRDCRPVHRPGLLSLAVVLRFGWLAGLSWLALPGRFAPASRTMQGERVDQRKGMCFRQAGSAPAGETQRVPLVCCAATDTWQKNPSHFSSLSYVRSLASLLEL